MLIYFFRMKIIVFDFLICFSFRECFEKITEIYVKLVYSAKIQTWRALNFRKQIAILIFFQTLYRCYHDKSWIWRFYTKFLDFSSYYFNFIPLWNFSNCSYCRSSIGSSCYPSWWKTNFGFDGKTAWVSKNLRKFSNFFKPKKFEIEGFIEGSDKIRQNAAATLIQRAWQQFLFERNQTKFEAEFGLDQTLAKKITSKYNRFNILFKYLKIY